MKLFGIALTSAQYIETLKQLNLSLSTDNQSLAHQLNEQKRQTMEHQENSRKLYAYQKELENLNHLFSDEIDKLKKECTEWEYKLDETIKAREALLEKYESQNQTIAEIVGPWKKKLQQVQGRLGAYIKKYGDLPHKRENQRKRKQQKQNETTQNPTAN